jgi:hypothetical protein
MTVYLVTYELNSKTSDYSALFAALKNYKLFHQCIENAWLIASNDPVVQIQNNLNGKIYQGDFILIIKVNKSFGGWLPMKAWEWMNANIPF